jgi:hypothetical protein
MKQLTASLVSMFAFVCLGSSTAPASDSDVSARDGRYVPVDQRPSGSASIWKSYQDAAQNCQLVQSWIDVPVGCKVEDFRGYPTLFLTFSDTRAMTTYRDVVLDRVAAPFCDSFNRMDVPARLVMYVHTARLASVYGCDTGELSDWLSIAKY